jgi:hypothetical protein
MPDLCRDTEQRLPGAGSGQLRGGECHDLVALSERIRNSVYESFDIRLETDPLLL